MSTLTLDRKKRIEMLYVEGARRASWKCEKSIRRWWMSSTVFNLTDQQLAALIERGRGWPWNGYELRLMKEADRYQPKRLVGRKR